MDVVDLRGDKTTVAPAFPDDQNPENLSETARYPGQRGGGGGVWCEEIRETRVFVNDSEGSGTTRSGTAGATVYTDPASLGVN